MENNIILPQFELNLLDGKIRITITNGSYQKDIDYVSNYHYHADYELHYVQDGSFEFAVGDKKYLCKSNSLVIIPPNAYHTIRALGPGIKICFQYRVLQDSPSLFLTTDRETVADYHMYEADTFINIIKEFRESRSESAFIKLQSAVSIVILNMNDMLRQKNQAKAKSKDYFVKSAVIDKILDYIAFNYYKDISLSDISDALFFSERQLTRIIKTETGETFNKLLTRYRVSHAKKLISETDKTLEEISYAVGFSTYCGFWKAFRSCENILPSEYKKSISKKRDR
ncbi:MAG: helix-turn-helix domain-containing protein [Clostridia bacterium]|nr:helix-turn-helix domain-containing protein [Clostridia bacterium]